MQRLAIFTGVVFLFGSAAAIGQDFATMSADSVMACPSQLNELVPPDFDAPECRTEVSEFPGLPEGMTWIRGEVDVTDRLLSSPEPLGLQVMARGAREIYFNGVRVGQDGAPAANADAEEAGPMDSVTYLPRSIVRAGPNEVVLRFSDHQRLFPLFAPVQLVRVGPYQNPPDGLLRHYWPSIATFGVFVVALLYFGTTVLLHRNLSGSVALALLALFAAAQLATEAWRGIYPYAYPVHDRRLLLLVIFSLGFGACLWAHLAVRFLSRGRISATAAVFIITAVSVLTMPGFDLKTVMAVFVPTVAGAVTMLWIGVRRDRSALAYCAALSAFAVVITLSVGQFLDRYFFFSVSALLIFFFVQQAIAMRRLDDERRLVESRASRLEAALEQVRRENRNMTIQVRSAGKVEFVDVRDLSHCSGAGDYVELCLQDGKSLLHQSTLNELESELPAEFVRVHRSHIVNTSQIGSLSRKPSGVGRLLMANGATVPVSRRIMPKVRDALVDPGLQGLAETG